MRYNLQALAVVIAIATIITIVIIVARDPKFYSILVTEESRA